MEAGIQRPESPGPPGLSRIGPCCLSLGAVAGSRFSLMLIFRPCGSV